MPGEVLGLVGDNSAGKSTLMKILTGVYHRDSGDIFVEGKPVQFKTPLESRDVGIEMIYQDFALCGNTDVSVNMFLGRWLTRTSSSTSAAWARRRNRCCKSCGWTSRRCV